MSDNVAASYACAVPSTHACEMGRYPCKPVSGTARCCPVPPSPRLIALGFNLGGTEHRGFRDKQLHDDTGRDGWGTL
jgi:hypothetical protein